MATWMPIQARTSLVVCALLALFPTGCATVGLTADVPNPLVVPSADFETVWMACVTALDDYFDIASENRLQRRIVTEPQIGATLAEPWYGDSVGFQERLEASLQTIRRIATVTVTPTATGSYAVKVEVQKQLEDQIKPEKQSAGRAVFDNEFPVSRGRELVGPMAAPVGWIPRGRDAKLERAILAKIKSHLFL
jgi:hypothetical protein